MDAKEKFEAQALANRVIEGLGGTAKAANFFETSESAVSQWRRNGISKPRLQYARLLRPDLFKVETPPRDLCAAPLKRSRRPSPPP